MASLGSLLVNIGVTLDGALKVEDKLRGLRQSTKELGEKGAENLGFFGRAFKTLGKEVTSLSGQIGKQLTESFQGADVAIAGTTLRLGGVPGIALAAGQALAGAAKGVFDFVVAQTEGVSSTSELATTLHIGVEELQRLQYAASQSGVSSESLSVAIQKLTGNLDEIAQGRGRKANEGLERLGLTLADLQGKTKTQQIGIIGDALNKVSDASEQAAISAAIFGKTAGPEMAGLLAEGSAGLTELTSQAAGVFTPEQGEQAKEFHDILGQVEGQVSALARGIAIDLMPAVLDIVQGIRDWLAENDTFIQQGMGGVISGIADSVKDVISEFSMWTGLVGELTGALDSLGTAGDVVAGIFKVLSFNIRLIIAPISTIKSTIVDLIEVIESLGIISEQTANSSKLAIQGVTDELKAKDTKTSGGNVAGKSAPKPNQTFVTYDEDGNEVVNFFEATGANISGDPSEGRKAAARAGAKADKDAEKQADKEEKERLKRLKESAPTHWDLLKSLAGGNLSMLSQRITDLGSLAPPTSAAAPTVAMDVTINNFDNDFHITSSEPVEVGKEVSAALKKAWAKAGQSLVGTKKR
jgi:hypothetical protein